MSQRETIDHKRNGFLAYFDPPGDEVPFLRPAPPLAYRRTVQTDSCSVTLHYGEPDMLTADPATLCVLLLAGDVCRPQAANIGQTILDLYERHGQDAVKMLDGMFSLLIIDPRRDQILIATDRMNSIKILTSRQDKTLIISNSLYLHPVSARPLDRTAVACYLAGGYLYNNQTLFEGVEMLDGASVYRYEDGSLKQHKYWRFIFTPPSVAPSTETLKKEFGDLLVEAVRWRLRPERDIYLSLTAGYDGCAMLGILANHFQVPDVHCFTYAHGSSFRSDSDEALAPQLAAVSGYRHEIVESFDGDAVRVIERNGRMGGGMARTCDEVDAWVSLGAEVKNRPLPIMYTGDTLQLDGGWSVKTYDDIVGAARLRDFSVLSWLKPLMGGVYEDFLAATRGEIERAVRRAPIVEDGRDFREMVRFDQIHSRATGTWREYFSARDFEPVHPLLDNDVVDFILRLPYEQRRDRTLYKATVTAMFPKLFEIPRARTSSYNGFWPEAFRRQRGELMALIQNRPNRLDDVIDPEILLALLSSPAPAAVRSNAALKVALRSAFRLLKRIKWNRTRLGRPWLFKQLVPVETFLTRALIVREFLAEVDG